MSASTPTRIVSPRSVADKSQKSALLAAIRMTLEVESSAVRHNTQTFNSGRYRATAAIPDYETLKNQTRAIKEAALIRLPELLTQTEESVKRNGGHFFLARNGNEASKYITEVCRKHEVRLVVKGKSMTSEEVHLNHYLEAAGIEVAETDLAEFILQIADEQPSHLIGPALHYSRERITDLFKRKFQTDLPLDTGEELTRFAREMLRQKFLNADAGISGANFVTADSGTIVLVESEGNIRLTSQLPPLHIAIAGIEKVLPRRADLAPFIELLAPSATGQGLASYTSVITPPLSRLPVLSERQRNREFHLVLVDNGRMQMREDPVLHEALYCIRCSACLNSCANFQTVGGHAFGGENYSGGIGGAWEAGTKDLLNARFSELCSGCSRCVNQCPVRIDIPWLNSNLRERINERDAAAGPKLQKAIAAQADEKAPVSKIFFGRYDLFGKWGARLAPLSNWMNGLPFTRSLLERFVGVDHRRELPPFAEKTLVALARSERFETKTAHRGRVAFFPDIFTNYGSSERGLAAIRVLRSVGVDVVLTEVSADGRASLSQGLIETAKQQALRTSEILQRYIREEREIVVVEPSVLAMFRLDYRHFLPPDTFNAIRTHSFETVEYLWRILQERQLSAEEIFAGSRTQRNRVFYHSHCHQKTVGAAMPTELLLRAAGFDVVTSKVECCGMAGSFGYKKDFYELSRAVGEDLFSQVREAEADGERILVATGVSCQEQLHAGLNRRVLHPMELLLPLTQTSA